MIAALLPLFDEEKERTAGAVAALSLSLGCDGPSVKDRLQASELAS